MPEIADLPPLIFTQRIIVGVCDFTVSNSAVSVVSTYALGSCVCVTAYEPGLKIGGLIHFMLPQSTIAPERATRHPAMFADTGLPLFFRDLAGLGALSENLRFLVTGGASVLSGRDPFRIGERNVDAALQYLAQAGCTVAHQETGASLNRTVHLELATGTVIIQQPQGRLSRSLA